MWFCLVLGHKSPKDIMPATYQSQESHLWHTTGPPVSPKWNNDISINQKLACISTKKILSLCSKLLISNLDRGCNCYFFHFQKCSSNKEKKRKNYTMSILMSRFFLKTYPSLADTINSSPLLSKSDLHSHPFLGCVYQDSPCIKIQ